MNFQHNSIICRQYAAAEPSDLYSSWQEALAETNIDAVPAGETIESVFRTWDSNPGYPLITVNLNPLSGVAQISQVNEISSFNIEFTYI